MKCIIRLIQLLMSSRPQLIRLRINPGQLVISLKIIPEPTARSAVPGVSPGRELLIPHGYLHPGKSEHSEV